MNIDYRTLQFDLAHVASSGRFLGRRLYWKVYSIENNLRVVINSVLSVQLGKAWFQLVAGRRLRRKVSAVRGDYLLNPQHASPGAHDIYYVFLPDLIQILTLNNNLFLPIIPDVNNWVIQLESIRLPRNLIGHMNWPNNNDIALVEQAYRGMNRRIKQISTRGVVLQIP